MKYPVNDYPQLKYRHIKNARLLVNRYELVLSLSRFKGGTVAEVGVATGDFSKFLIESLSPSEFVAIDTFGIHNWPTLWGKRPREIFGDLTHRQFYEQKLSPYSNVMRCKEGVSYEVLKEYDDNYFDLIYIDANHSYESVKKDAEVSDRKVKDNGVIIFNDYIMYDHLSEQPYGVVQAANELIVGRNYEIEAFALGMNMFCDVAVRKVR